jgi:putative hydrolase of HD superfamily
MEMDKLKSVDRMTKIICQDRVENDAEHSWHVALMALVLEPATAKDAMKLEGIEGAA